MKPAPPVMSDKWHLRWFRYHFSFGLEFDTISMSKWSVAIKSVCQKWVTCHAWPIFKLHLDLENQFGIWIFLLKIGQILIKLLVQYNTKKRMSWTFRNHEKFQKKFYNKSANIHILTWMRFFKTERKWCSLIHNLVRTQKQ